ncbi:MAG: LapA family protein [Roseiarcus sp.]
MKNLLKFIVLTPIAVLILAFALANMHTVKVSFDPFAAGDVADFAITAPLFLILFLAVMIGVLAGGAATWLTQGKHRKAARENRAEAERLRGQVQALRSVQSDNRAGPGVNLQHHA